MKNLIYYTVGFLSLYEDLFLLSLESLEKFYDGHFEVLIICNEKTKTSIKKKLNTKIPVQFLIVNCTQKRDSSMNKLKIHSFDNITNYEKIIFCDSDILWVDSPNKIFESTLSDKINFSEENGFMDEQYWGGKLLTNDEIVSFKTNRVKGVNAGFFSFYSNMSTIFNSVETFMNENLNKINVCWEQPYLNIHLQRKNLITRTLNKHINHHVKENDVTSKVVCHFSGSPGAGKSKLVKMQKFLENNGIKL